MYCLIINIFPRLFFHGAIVAAILTWGPNWARERFFDLHQATFELLYEKLKSGGPPLPTFGPNPGKWLNGTHLKYEEIGRRN